MKTVVAFLVAPAVIPAVFLPLYAMHVAIFGTIGVAEAFRRFTTNVFAMIMPAAYFTVVMGGIPLYFLLRRFKKLGFITILLSACALGLLSLPKCSSCRRSRIRFSLSFPRFPEAWSSGSSGEPIERKNLRTKQSRRCPKECQI